ncbi:hypothetical protein RHECNPAF_2190071 [Rhizobium etli CNPAF512]|nr:hypothetical protein RHECNPAF_2190071 [Rhizobium etli CNPAF512]
MPAGQVPPNHFLFLGEVIYFPAYGLCLLYPTPHPPSLFPRGTQKSNMSSPRKKESLVNKSANLLPQFWGPYTN